MAIYKISDNSFKKLDETNFHRESLLENTHLQKYIANSIEVLGNDLLVVSTEFSNWQDSSRRIDILCVDKEGKVVVIELKRTLDGGFMDLQAIRYAAMVANITYEQTLNCYTDYLKKTNQSIDAEESLSKFLNLDSEGGVSKDDFGKNVRIILVSADFGKELTTSVLWLNEQNMNIQCFRINLQKDNENLYFDINQIIPLPEALDYQVKQKEKIEEEKLIREQNTREKNIILRLFDSGKIKEGDRFYLKPAIDQGVDKELVCATLERRGSKCLRFKNELYSFSNLRGIFVKKYNILDIQPSWGFNMKYDWMNEQGNTLEELDKI